jgi:hypothetical protein
MQATSSRPMLQSKVVLVVLGVAIALALILVGVTSLSNSSSRVISGMPTGTTGYYAEIARHQASERADATQGGGVSAEIASHQASERADERP